MQTMEREREEEKRVRDLLEVCRQYVPLKDYTFEKYIKRKTGITLVKIERIREKAKDLHLSEPVFIHVSIVRDVYEAHYLLGKFRIEIVKGLWQNYWTNIDYILEYKIKEVRQID